jgi:rhodanese-related sulfurtransferase
MNWKRFFLEALAIVVIAAICASVANAIASRERRLALVASYGSSTKPSPRPAQPTQSVAPIADPMAPSGTMTTAQAAVAEPLTATTTAAVPTATTTTATTKTAVPVPVPAGTAPPAPARASRAEILKRFPPHPDTAAREISGEEAAWLHQNGALFLDARRTSAYEQGHIAGAKNFAVWEADIDDRVKNLLNEVSDQEMPIVIYCTGGACEDSHMLAQKIWGVFFTNALVYKDGFPDWQKRGGATATGQQR